MSGDGGIELATEVAVIGYAGRFPGAGDVGQYWSNLREGVESIRSFSSAELASVGVGAEALRDPDYVRVGAPLAGLDGFDAGFFGISPREAAIMDPQQRFFLECAWEALEHAGYAPGTFGGSTGVFAGSGPNSYLIHNLLSDAELVRKDGIFLLRHTGNDKDVLATRVSYQMNLHGPSLNVQTACSTSLVAVHLACQSLLHLDCDLALAGAVSIEMPHAIGYQYRQNEIQSHDGHCRSFDANATGTVFGSGIGIVVLKRLPEAIAAGDTIHAVIKGTAVNNDGSRKVGFLAPSAEGQVEVINEALGAAGVEPATVDYIETHGTGTPIGDPIELSALDQVFARRTRPLRIGAVKTNIGHCDTAAGMAGLLKTILALQHRQIPATLHFQALNPLVDARTTKLQVVDRLTDWAAKADSPRRAGVTSLGIGGTNAHVILEEAPEAQPSEPGRPVKLWTISAKTVEALEGATAALAQHLQRHPEENLDDAAYTLHVGRRDFAQRRMFVARDGAEAKARAEGASGVVTGKAVEGRTVAFLFSGQGSQYVNAGAELYRHEPVFKKWLDRCAEQARPHLGFDFRELLHPAPEKAEEAAAQIKLTWNAQPILFALEYCLAQVWLSWGIKPAKMIGHSLGEYTAATLAGVFTLEDALALVCARGNLMKKVGEGAMLAVSLSEAGLTPWLTNEPASGLALAAVNGAEQCVVSGPTGAILALKEKLAGQRIASQRLETSHAFHSSALDPVLDAFVELVAKKKRRAPRIPIVSNVTGTWLTEAEATDPHYWGRHFRQTVRFYDGIKLLQSDAESCLLEVGPGETLASFARQNVGPEARARIVPSLPRAGSKSGDLTIALHALGALWVHGVNVDWQAFHAAEKRRRVPLPAYAFQRKKCWIGPKIGTNWLGEALGKVDDWFYRASWKSAPLPAGTGAGPWLVFAHGDDVAGAMRQQNATVLGVTAGEKFTVRGDSYEINPAEPGDYTRLLEHLIERKLVPRQIAYLWGENPGDAAEDRCFHHLLYLLQSLGAKVPDQAVAITAVSRRSVSMQHEPVLHPYGSLLGGPCRVAPLEYPTLRCRQVDLDQADAITLAGLLLAEGESDTSVSLAVYRDGVRWVQGLDRFHPEPVADRLRDKGTYLITGGLGGLGLAIADWLARTYHARLILLSRHGKTDAAQDRQLAEWRRLGADVLVVAGDVTDRDSLRPALAAAQEKFGALHGIIHAAGVLQDGIIQLKKKSVAHSVLAPKTIGVQNLDELTRDQPLEFFALFSSVSALTPPDGQVDYCAANAFLQAYAQSQPPARNFLVIGWGPWSQVGMVAPKTDSAAEPFVGIPTLEGVTTFGRVLKSHLSDITYVSPVPVTPGAPMRDADFLADSVTGGSDDVNLVLEQLWRRLLPLKDVDAQTDFFDAGGHSLLAVRLFTEIRKRFNIDFGLSTLFEARTIGALAELIRRSRHDEPSAIRSMAGKAMVAIRPRSNTSAPLFLIHDVGGAVLRYEHLARHFPDDQAIYAIESRGLSGLPADYTVEAMARHYLRVIRERQPRGPYYVAGHSFGGLVTYEIARQLVAQGEKMGLVGLLDTFQHNLKAQADGPQPTLVTGRLPLFRRLVTDARAVLLGRDRIGYLQERKTYVQAWAVKTTYRTAFRLSRHYGLKMPSFLNDAMEANWIASDYFQPEPFDGRIVLFRCKNRLETDPPDAARVWLRLARGGVTIVEVPGDHNSMLREPGVQILAEQIMSYLRPPTGATLEKAA